MRSRSVAVAVSIAVLSAAGAVGCYIRADALHTEARWLLERSRAEGEAWVNTFDGEVADRQIATMEERRGIVERAHLWQRGQLLLILLTVVAAFSSYVLYLLHRLRHSLEYMGADLPVPTEGNPGPRPRSRAQPVSQKA